MEAVMERVVPPQKSEFHNSLQFLTFGELLVFKPFDKYLTPKSEKYYQPGLSCLISMLAFIKHIRRVQIVNENQFSFIRSRKT